LRRHEQDREKEESFDRGTSRQPDAGGRPEPIEAVLVLKHGSGLGEAVRSPNINESSRPESSSLGGEGA